jgi:hypothetical protein
VFLADCYCFRQFWPIAALAALDLEADFDYYTALARSALRYGQPLTGAALRVLSVI